MLIQSDARDIPLDDASVDCVVTSPPYWGLRDYGVDGQLGLEKTPAEYVARMVEVFQEVKRVLKPAGTCWLNLGDSYAGSGKGGNPEGSCWSGFVGRKDREASAKASPPIIPAGLKPKDLVGIPWRTALALQDDGWWLRAEIIWAKPNPMPESVTDRPTRSHEQIFLLTKAARYYFDAESVAEPVSQTPGAISRRRNFDPAKQSKEAKLKDDGMKGGNDGARDPDATERNIRSVWTIATQPYPGAHFATFPEALVTRCILAGCPVKGTVLDPFCGSGTTVRVARSLGRNGIGLDINPEYLEQARQRIRVTQGLALDMSSAREG